MVTAPYAAHWLGLVDAAGVAFAFLLWLLIAGRPTFARRVVAAAGAALLVLLTGVAIGRVASLVAAGLIRSAGLTDQWRYGVLLLVAFVAGLLVWWNVADDDPVPDPAPAAAVDAEADMLTDSDPRPRSGSLTLLAAAAAGIALPAYGFLPRALSTSRFFNRPVQYGHIGSHLISGLIAGLALAGVVLAYDRFERSAVAAAFGLVALGPVLGVALPRVTYSAYWAYPAGGLVVALLLPVALRSLRRLAAVESAVLVGAVVIAVALPAAQGAFAAKSFGG